MLKKFFLVVLSVFELSAFAADCTTPRQQGCWEIVALNIAWDSNNSLMQGLDKTAANADERLRRAETLGMSLWQAQHQGAVRAAGSASFLVFIWNGGVVEQPYGFQVTGNRTINRYVAENVKGKVTPSKLDGYGEPDAVYRIRTDGVSASILLPWSVLSEKSFIIICREGNSGVYPNTTTLKQGHAISRETLMWYKGQPEGSRTLVPFLSKS